MKEFKYKTTFSSVIKPIISKDKDLFLAKASLEQLRAYIPNIDLDKNYDLLGVAIPLFNVNYFNKNDDGLDTSFALQIYKSFINKFINLEHSRDRLVGTILSAHITEFGTDKPLTEEDVKDTKDVFNITVGGVLWRVVNENLAELIEDSNSILSDNYNKIKASLEVGFTDYNIIVCPPNSRSLAEGTLVKDSKELEQLSANLKAFGGSGKTKDGKRVYRLLGGEGIGLGCGITENPAAELNAIAVNKETESTATITISPGSSIINTTNQDLTITSDSVIYINSKDLIPQSSSKDLKEIEGGGKNNFSQSNNSDVIKDNKEQENSNSRKHMKITNLKDITDDLLKEAKASSIVEFVETELKAASEKFAKEKQEKETVAQELQKKHDELLKNHDQLIKDMEALKASLEKLEQEKAAKDNQERFNVRMASFEEKFELTQDEVAVIGAQIKDLDDEQYKNVEKNLHTLLKHKDKQTIAEQKKIQEVKASENKETKTEQKVVEDALNTAKQTSKEIAATQTVTSPSLKEKFDKAFAPDQFILIK